MFTTTVLIKSLTDVELIERTDKSLSVRWLYGVSNDKNIAFKLWNELTESSKLIIGSEIEVEFRIESREAKGKYYTDLTVTKIR